MVSYPGAGGGVGREAVGYRSRARAQDWLTCHILMAMNCPSVFVEHLLCWRLLARKKVLCWRLLARKKVLVGGVGGGGRGGPDNVSVRGNMLK